MRRDQDLDLLAKVKLVCRLEPMSPVQVFLDVSLQHRRAFMKEAPQVELRQNMEKSFSLKCKNRKVLNWVLCVPLARAALKTTGCG